MRWARDHDLPVHRMPGGKQGSVFAFESELAAWSLKPDDNDVPPVADLPTATPRRDLRWIVALLLIAVFAGLSAGVYWLRSTSPASVMKSPAEVPSDMAVAADYITARDSGARRTPRDIARAIALYRTVIRRDPTFAPAYAGLAEAWLVYREYGDIDDPTAYNAARTAAEQALRLDPNLPGAHRALGFIHYWWGNAPSPAVAAFKRAIDLDDRDAQNHFWYANVLADLGEDAAAEQEYRRARLLSPGSRMIEVEYACSNWQAGRDRQALQQLTALSGRYPDDATIHNCLAWVHISAGDIVGFAREYRLMALARNEPQLLRLTERLNDAVQRDPTTAHRVLIADAREKIATGSVRIRETPAFFASAMGDRQQLVTLMSEARNLGEHWFSASIRHRIARRWKGDREIERLVIDLAPPPISEKI